MHDGCHGRPSEDDEFPEECHPDFILGRKHGHHTEGVQPEERQDKSWIHHEASLQQELPRGFPPICKTLGAFQILEIQSENPHVEGQRFQTLEIPVVVDFVEFRDAQLRLFVLPRRSHLDDELFFHDEQESRDHPRERFFESTQSNWLRNTKTIHCHVVYI